ncbi:helix-turn-helix transcriptional regulator [Microbacterium sp. CFBP 8790]|uniref:helix-turn-helix domain-containing protein n=1 Tax=Microbacterium sp. CFBP 8801 TaxID=2774036 RepID=UPI00177D97CD|nr:helix-turn-helix transcriptional regulator [Microbacterium sp. CFBP 8801]MBD8509152.1 helix-turn-helix transcriptional regulator [Microbacterium sp. CFBP 8790]
MAATGAAEDAIIVLGQHIRLARLARGITAEHLAGSAGITRKNLAAIESGSAAVSIGNVFNVATIVGVPLVNGVMGARCASSAGCPAFPMLATAGKTRLSPPRRVLRNAVPA